MPKSIASSRRSSAYRAGAALLGAIVVSVLALGTVRVEQAQALRYNDCPDDIGFFECTKVRVPIDRAGTVPGSVDLTVEHLYGYRKPGRKAVFMLAGGPGQSVVPFGLNSLFQFGDALGSQDLVLFDQRGTGRSGVLRCPSLEAKRIGNIGAAMGACAAAIGPRRRFYTTWDSAQDIEAVRRALGIGKVTLIGVSYGTKLAETYARLYPNSVDKLVLDSVVRPDGPDPLQRSSLGAIPRVLNALCASNACRDVSRDPTADMAKLVARLATSPISGPVIGGDGKPHARHLGRLRLLDLLYAGDFDSQLRSGLPGAIQAALRGDSAPLLRLSHRATVQNRLPPATDLSVALFFATTCEEGPLPWSPSELPLQQRWNGVFDSVGALPPSAFAPFDRQTAAASAEIRFCVHWPSSGPQRTPPPAALPDVPALVLSGEADLRTPAEDAAAVASEFPHAIKLTIPLAGHSVVGSDQSGCAADALTLFLRGKPVTGCGSRAARNLRVLRKNAAPPAPVPPLSLDEVQPAPGVGGDAGKLLRAAEFAYLDASQSLPFDAVVASFLSNQSFVLRIGGLRGGRLIFRSSGTASLRRYSYVPGVAISGTTPRRESEPLRLTVDGDAGGGVVVFDAKRRQIRGRLAGRRFNLHGLGELLGAIRSFPKGARKPDGAPVFGAPITYDDPLKLALDQ